MSAAVTFQRNMSGISASPLRSTQDVTADAIVAFDGTVAASQTDFLISLNLDVSQIRALFMLVTGGDVLLQSNDGTTPDDTITLKDGVALIWDSISGYFDNPFSADVTAIYATTSAGSQRSLQIYAVLDL